MRKRALIILLVIALIIFKSNNSYAQGVAVNTTGAAANASAMLDVASTTQGVLVPRMDSAQRTLIVSPATGLLVYQTDGVAPGFYYNSGSAGTPAWTSLSNLPNTTVQGNTFNGNSQLVQTTAAGKLPTIDGSALTNLNGANLQANSVTVGKLPSGSGSATTYLNGAGGWTTPSSSGGSTTIDLVATKTAAQNAAPEANTTIIFDNATTAPTIGSYNSGTGAYTVGTAGVYLIQICLVATSNSSIAPVLLVGGTAVRYGSGGASGFYPAPFSRGTLTAVMQLASGNVITVQGSNGSSTVTGTMSTDGTTELTIVKL